MEYVCNLCPRSCGAIRTETTNVGGICKMPYILKVAKASVHKFEEPCISGTRGSGTIFFSGCSLQCEYCQNYKISHNGFGKEITPAHLSEIFKSLEQKGVHNINLVSPTHYVPLIIEALELYRPHIPIIYNSSGYETEDTLELLKNYIDVYLLDFKYFSSEKSALYSKASNYPECAMATILKAYSNVGTLSFNENGILTKGVIIRHLLLPSATSEAISIIDWLTSQELDVLFSLMNQYTVMPQVTDKHLKRKVTEREYLKVQNHLMTVGLKGYLQSNTSASEKYIPSFDLEGI